MATLTYSRQVFDVADEAAARRIILTPTETLSTDERWVRETPYLADLLGEQLAPQRNSLIVDYGCGVGRLAKLMIERFGCRVIGVDISERMRALAPDYVASQHFSAVSPHMLHSMVEGGLRVSGALSVWVLQHTLSPALDIDLLSRSLGPDAPLTVVNMHVRAVPTAEGQWARDGVDVRALLRNGLDEVADGVLDPSIVGDDTSRQAFWATYRPR